MKKIFMAIASVVLACGIGVAAVGCGASDTINVYNRDSASGTRAAFIELLGIDETELYSNGADQNSTGAVLTTVAGDEKGIGYISLGSLDETVKAVSIDGVEPTVQNIVDEKYTVWRPFELMYQEEKVAESDLATDFLKFLGSAQAQEVIEDYGYVSTVTDAPEYTAPETDFQDTTIDVGGSTSVQPLIGTDDGDAVCLITKYKELLGDKAEGIQINVSGNGSGQGITNAGNGTWEIGLASKEVNAETDFKNPTGTMKVVQLCADGIAVIVNTANTVTNLTTEMLKNIYTGAVKSWSEVPGWTAPDAE